MTRFGLLHRPLRRAVLLPLLLAFNIGSAQASDLDAIDISTNIQLSHMPYDTLLDPVFGSSDPASLDYTRIVSYSRAGDSAIWTGHYLAAEAFHYQVTRSSEALDSVRRALRGIRSLLDVTGTNLLARCAIPVSSPFASAIQQAEGLHGIYSGKLAGKDYFWIGNTSRDQYSGVMFGLAVAYDLVDDVNVREFVRADVTRIVSYLLQHNWNVVMPDRKISTSFKLRPDQQLAFLQIARHIDPATFGTVYSSYRETLAGAVILPIAYDNADDHSHYFKFNLNYITFYNLVRLEEQDSPYLSSYLQAYAALRRNTRTHGNAHFNMIDRVLRSANSARDAETASLLGLWLQRPRRDYWIDLRGKYPSCGSEDRACSPIPVDERVNTDFLWQRSPFLLYGGGFGTIETAGIDYILPYWMARAFGVL